MQVRRIVGHTLPYLRPADTYPASLPCEEAHTVAEFLLFPGWQVVHWLTGGLMARNFEYKLLLPMLIIAINIAAWGGVVWAAGNLRDH